MENRYIGGLDWGEGKSNSAFILFDRQEQLMKFISTKKWQIRIILFLCKIFSITVMIENGK